MVTFNSDPTGCSEAWNATWIDTGVQLHALLFDISRWILVILDIYPLPATVRQLVYI